MFYLLGLKALLAVLMIVMAVCGIDDLFIDVYYWVRRFWRETTTYKKYSRKEAKELYKKPEQPLAIMVPAWQEHGVIGKMAELAASQLDYENYQIFVGTYPNDPETQSDVDKVCAQYPNVHKVVCARPGPTSKADCLNNVIASIIEFEKKAKLEFAGFILHDSEDVLSSMELRLFNYLLPDKDLIQLPVYPYTRKWYQMTPGHYADEFAELHGKDVVVREAIAGQVPSAGVGTCFSRKAVLRLLVEGDGLPFDVQSLTEDYDIGFRLKQWGMNEIFVRFPVIDKDLQTLKEDAFGVSLREGSVVCVREYFPTTFSTAVRQKSRWIIGIVFQGFKNHKWTNDWRVNYFLWRDRRGVISNVAGFLAMFLLIQLVSLSLYSHFVEGAYRFMSLIGNDPFTYAILTFNALLLANRLFQRFYFVSRYYGYAEGVLSIVRLAWGNVINFAANLRAIRQVIEQGDPRRVAWDKTTHDFPSVTVANRKKPLGQILVEKGHLSSEQLETVIMEKPKNKLLGMYLVESALISNEQLSEAIAEQCQMPYVKIEPFELDHYLVESLPKKMALKYSVLPIGWEDGVLILGKESALSPVGLSAIKRKLGVPVRWVITTNGAVTLGLRYWYLDDRSVNPNPEIQRAINEGKLSTASVEQIKGIYFATQSQLGSCLLSAHLIEPAVLHQAILAFENVSDMSLGEFLVEKGYLQELDITRALELQNDHKRSIPDLIIRQCVEKEPLYEV
ncbi:phage adsorption protein NrfB [Vibrio coralliilyticus]|uniref:Glycosyl transferase family 2 n=2 Tax=Vibrio coralliilyticus TaxID=190893 RepID=A0AAN0VY56_9VIBR|nr:glycosyl transferase family protein [Vibrio coralliilyticus]AIW20478.1 glycosyl transferase family 2 [Vibrio coralliilyticus]NOH38550.1 phage adsorption protein NrfB [Vibrio coralliilyticus]